MQIPNTKRKAMELTDPLGRRESKYETHLPCEVFIREQLQRLIRCRSKALKNQGQVPIQSLNLSCWKNLLEATEHPAA